MSTGAAVGAAASAQAAAALAAAEQARCTAVVKGYRTEGASLVEMRDYAKCVRTLYGTGEPMDAASAVLLKVVIVLSLIAGAAGAWKGWADEGPVESGLYAVGAALLVWVVAFLIALVVIGVGFVLS